MDLVHYPLFGVENNREIIEHCDLIGNEQLPAQTQMGGNTNHRPLHVFSEDYVTENPYCMTVRVGDTVFVTDT